MLILNRVQEIQHLLCSKHILNQVQDDTKALLLQSKVGEGSRVTRSLEKSSLEADN